MSKLKKLRDDAFHRQGGLCWYCRRPMSAATHSGPYRCTAEHLLAQCDGGQDAAENIVAACWLCNTRRHKRKTALAPEAYQAYVRTRLAKGKWFNPKGAKTEAPTPPPRVFLGRDPRALHWPGDG